SMVRRDHCKTDKPLWIAFMRFHEGVVECRRERTSNRSVCEIDHRLGQGECLHVHSLPVHVGYAQIKVDEARLKRAGMERACLDDRSPGVTRNACPAAASFA